MMFLEKGVGRFRNKLVVGEVANVMILASIDGNNMSRMEIVDVDVGVRGPGIMPPNIQQQFNRTNAAVIIMYGRNVDVVSSDTVGNAGLSAGGSFAVRLLLPRHCRLTHELPDAKSRHWRHHIPGSAQALHTAKFHEDPGILELSGCCRALSTENASAVGRRTSFS
jgi:hypothetical protein